MVASIVRVTFIMAATAAYFGLAVLGWGGPAAFFSHPPLIALAVALFVIAGVAFFADGNLSPGVREDRDNRWVIAAFALIGLLAAYLPAYTDRKEFWTLDGDNVRWIGVVLFAAGGALRLWPVVVLGNRFSGLVAATPAQLFGVARQLAGVGTRLSVWSRPADHGAHHPAAPRAHPRGREAAAHTVRRRVRCLPGPDVADNSGPLLRGC